MDSSEEVDLPPPPDDPAELQEEGCRLWIGNLDTRVTEFSLLKLLQKYGELSKFDFLYHKSGPDQGKPRGYCFVTYCTREGAEKAKRYLDGKLALSKRLVVKNAKTEKRDFLASTVLLPKPATKKECMSKEAQIRAIEAKLRLMEKGIKTEPVISGPSKDTRGSVTVKKIQLGKPTGSRSSLHAKPYSQNYSKSSSHSRDRNR